MALAIVEVTPYYGEGLSVVMDGDRNQSSMNERSCIKGVETALWSRTKASPQGALDMNGLPQTTCQCN